MTDDLLASRISRKAGEFTESVIREMTRQAMKYGAVNLSQGFPDFPAPRELKEAAKAAIDADINQYAITWGAKRFRDAIAAKVKRCSGMEIDPETELTVCCGSTEAMISSLLAVLNAGDEAIIFEPYYENYGPDSILSDAVPRFVKLRPEKQGDGWQWRFDEKELRAAFNNKTRAIVINTPNNPTGKVFTRPELDLLAGLCQQWDVIAFTDEIYEHILYGEQEHIYLATLPGMRERTVTINGMSKTYSVTGWRVGWAVAPPDLSSAIRKVHDFLTVGAAAPLQDAGALACALPASYYTKLAADYRARRDRLVPQLEAAGFICYKPDGAYYVMTDISGFGFENDIRFSEYLIREIGVSVVPGSSFYNNPADGAQQVRFCFCKRDETLDEAGRRLSKLRGRI